MSIEWRRVTWYSQVIAIVLFVFVFFLGFGLGSIYGSKGEGMDYLKDKKIINNY